MRGVETGRDGRYVIRGPIEEGGEWRVVVGGHLGGTVELSVMSSREKGQTDRQTAHSECAI